MIQSSDNTDGDIQPNNRIWVVFEDTGDASQFNQPVSVPFAPADTVDDLKVTIFNRFHSTRWSQSNDSASIALGFYSTQNTNPIMHTALRYYTARTASTDIRIIFQPDESILSIYETLFGELGSQKADDALVIFSSFSTGATIRDNSTVAFDPVFYIPSPEEIEAQQNFINNKSPGTEDAREFKLVTDANQLRKLSRDNNTNTITSPLPKHAILLLPKNTNPKTQLHINTTDLISETNQDIYSPSELDSQKDLFSPTRYNNNNNSSSSVTVPRHPFPIQHKSTSEQVFPRINVLIVEDNVINRTILSSFLKKHKISYKVAKNGREAVDIWKEGGLHLIFMDLQLPVLSGIDAVKEIRASEKDTGIGNQKSLSSRSSEKKAAPVIIVAFTASQSLADKREALISGCNDYLTKPVNLHWLSKKITEWGCMQGLIDFDNWKQGQSRMTDSVLVKQSPKIQRTPSRRKSSARSLSTASSKSSLRNSSR